MTLKFKTREQWLAAAIVKLGKLFKAEGAKLPDVRVSVGFPGGRSRGNGHVIGQCWATTATADGKAQLFVSPVKSDAVTVLAVLTHELVHAWDDCKSGHTGQFRRMALALGLEGKMTATVAGDELKEKLAAIAESLGEYPHAALKPSAFGPKQGTRMLKVSCPESGYVVRTTAKWLLAYGAPICPCHAEVMTIA